MDASMASRDRSPLKYPGAASQSLNPTYTHSQAFDNALDNSYTAQTSLDESYNQNLNHFQQQLGMNNTDPAYQDFQSSAQHFNLEPSDIAQALHTENFSNPSIIDPHQSPHHLSNGTSPAPDLTNTSFQSFNFDSNNLDPTLDPLIDTNLLQEQSAGNIADPMSTGIAHTSTPPHLLPGMMRHSSGSPSPRASPGLPQQASFGGITRPRNTSESLNPASAAFPQALGGAEWSNMGAYRHRRIASDNISELSSHSAHASPYLGNIDANPASPMLNPSDPSFGESFGMGDFSINERQPGSNFHSPAHSPQPSPRLVPQQQLPVFTPENNFGLNEPTMQGQFGQTNGFDPFSNQEPFPSLQQGLSPGSNELGQADHMSPPAINIDFAEPIRSSEAPPSGMGDLGLPPPPRRSRAKSDSYAGHRPGPSYIRGRSPSLQPENTPNLLFPSDPAVQSRSTSPRGRHGISSHQRTTSAASDQREYILDLANPERSPSNSGENRRSQKHPATFQCTLCPKRFTRAYNLRSHLRTHTDERPFVCTVCSKAFARQHDRKRHEGLHSGEKKFVCKGPLQSGQTWGCNRRFARADALGRHFRSEAGRICIKPLLDEEAAEQESKWSYQQQQAQQQAGFLPQQPNLPTSFLPQAILQLYPALAGIDLTTAQGPQDDEYNGRSSFDASSGGEMGLGDELSDNDMNNGYQYQNQQSVGELNRNFALGMQQTSQQHMNNYGGYQMSDYTNGMEGR